MAPSTLHAVACAGAFGVSALAMSKPEGLRFGQSSAQERRLPKPWPSDLSRWAEPAFLNEHQADGPLFSEASEFQRAEVRSLVGDYNLTIAAFDHWTDQGVSGTLLAGHGWETTHIADLCDRYRKFGSVGNFLDVGANIGTFTIPMADCLQSNGGRVIAVEGMPPTADHLAVGILSNNIENVDMYNYAIGAPGDEMKVTMSLNPVNKGGSTVKGNKPFTEMDGQELQDLFHPKTREKLFAKTVDVKEYEVPLTTGDQMLQYNPAMKAIMVAKVDIEGHEGHFIRGSQLLFSDYPPCILTIELIPEWLDRAGTPPEQLLFLLDDWGYEIVPTIAQLKKSATRTLTQKDMQACVERVRSYADTGRRVKA
jgi:FkbM family methyltransferase